MTAIFISHSSADNAAAQKMKTWLADQGHTSLFFDFDAETGIRSGEDWEQTLYHNLRQCQAMIALLTTNWLASRWCFAELVQAREKGKAIFPVKVEPCDASAVLLLQDIQNLDLTTNEDEGYQRLGLGLRERGLDPRDVFQRDPKRPLYPGLEAFKEADAAIFFGRTVEILKGLETLNALRRRGHGAARFVLFLGASGSGKSSLVRAGLIPRLRKTPSEWLPVEPFRPQGDPLHELSLSLADTFKTFGQDRSVAELQQVLITASDCEPADGQALINLSREISQAAGQRNSTVILFIDQAEELFGYSEPAAATRLLRLLRSALEKSDRQLMVVATLRSDFLGEFQLHRELQDPDYDHDLAYQAVPVDPMPERRFAEIIRGPAELEELQFESGLVEAMVRDTGTRDALPLLAFTLRRLYDRYAADGLIEFREYDALGRLEGSIRVEAERILREASPAENDLAALRAAFVPTMVRINADGGYARRRAVVNDMPRRAQPLLQRFVDARLLVSDRDDEGNETLEVSHEALLRTWPQLTEWLVEDRDKLNMLDAFQRAAADWDTAKRTADLLVHRGDRLQVTVALVAEHRFAVQPDSIERQCIDACVEAERSRLAADREEQERRVLDAERIAREQKKTAKRTLIGLIAALTLAMGASIVGWIAYQNAQLAEANANVANEREQEANAARYLAEVQQKVAERQRRIAKARELAAEANRLLDDTGSSLELSLLLTLESLRQTDTPQGHIMWSQLTRIAPGLAGRLKGVVGVSKDASALAASSEEAIRDWQAVTGGAAVLVPEARSLANDFSADGRWFATSSYSNRTTQVWDLTSGHRVAQLDNAGAASALAFSPDGQRLVTGTDSGTVEVWGIRSEEQTLALNHEQSIFAVAFNLDGSLLATWGRDNVARVWNIAKGSEVSSMEHTGMTSGGGRPAVAFHPHRRVLATASANGPARLWDVDTGRELRQLPSEGDASGVVFSPDGRLLAVVKRYSATVQVWNSDTGQEVATFVHARGANQEIRAVAFGPANEWLVTSGSNGTVRLWDIESGAEIARVQHGKFARDNIISGDRRWLVTRSDHAETRIWDLSKTRERIFRVDDPVKGEPTLIPIVHFSANGQWMAAATTSGRGSTVVVWDVPSRRETFRLDFERELRRMAFGPDSRWFAIALDNSPQVSIRDIATGRELTRVVCQEPDINLQFSPDGKWLATWGSKGTQIWEAANGHEVTRSDFSPGFLSKTHPWVGASRFEKSVVVWEPQTGRELARLPDADAWRMSISPDGAWVATSSEGSTTRSGRSRLRRK